ASTVTKTVRRGAQYIVRSVVDWRETPSCESRESILHRLERFRGVSLPVCDLTRDPQRTARAIGLRRIPAKLLVRQIGIFFKRAGRLDDVDSAAAVACGELRSPSGCVESASEVDVIC